MDSLLQLFAHNLLPIFLAAGAGYLLGKLVDLDARTVSRTTFYIFSPCLIFKIFTENQLAGSDVLHIGGFTLLFVVVIGALVGLAGLLFKLERKMLSAVLLTSMFTNAGNFGLSLNAFAFGPDVLAYAGLYYVFTALLSYSLGVLIASLGSANLKDSLLGLFKLPALWALVLGLLFNGFNWSMPVAIGRTVDIFAGAAIPTMLLLLGLQLQQAQRTRHFLPLGLVAGARLLVAPVLAIGLAFVVGLEGPARQASIVEASMPTAVLMTVLATEYDIEPSFVTTVVTVTTLFSPLVLTPLLAFLGS